MRAAQLTALFLLIPVCFADAAEKPQALEGIAPPAEALVLPPVGRGGRIAVPADPIQVSIASGKWAAPKAGDEVIAADGNPRKWEAAPFKGDVLAHRALQGGHAFVNVASPKEQVAILSASGHQMVFVNGEPRTGDIYSNGIVRLPVLLRKGDNQFLFHIARGSLKLSLAGPRAAAQLDLADPTAPDAVVGQALDAEAAVVVQNATGSAAESLAIEAKAAGGEAFRTPVPFLVPLAVRKVGFRVKGVAPEKEGPLAVELRLLRDANGKVEELDRATLNLNVKKPEDTRKITFRSGIDGSVQYYALVPAKPGKEKEPAGLVLTLHGAGVEALGQAACYAPKPGMHVVAATNRRPYGFDWEDWGRLDALEVLDHASKLLNADSRRAYLTGHSMGGHGTWHLGVTYPDRFAAIAPSAGWVSMWSYAGAKKAAETAPAEELLLRAANPSDTLALGRNFASTGIYVLHGDADDNVPVAQARTMRRFLSEFHGDFAYFEEPGAGHWWGKAGVSGSACVDWPAIFEFFSRRSLPEVGKVRSVEFRTANPGVSARCHWVTIEAQERALMVSTVDLKHDAAKRSFSGKTDNVARLSFDLRHLGAVEKLQVELDGQKLADLPWPEKDARLHLARTAGKWAAIADPGPAVKNLSRCGPFRDAFRNRMAFVYGTKGTAEENAWALAKARYDAEQFWYRGNGSVVVVPDARFDAAADKESNVILYGNADTNSAWKDLLGEGPVRVGKGAARIGEREEKGDNLACAFIRPRPGSERASVAAVSGTGLPGMRLLDRLPYFVSGVGMPDWMLLDAESLTRGAPAVRGAGYFGGDWKLESGESAWRKQAPRGEN